VSFDSTKYTLEKMLEQVDDGAIQLPEFQRDYVWDEEAVVSLLASIAKGYPVGALLLLERGGEVDFKPRHIEGANIAEGIKPDLLLLDGQQRMTSLYQVLWTERPAILKNVKGQKVERHLFLDIPKAVGEGVSFEEAVELLPVDRKRMKNFGREVDLDLSQAELQYAANMFPLDRIFDEDDWLYGWRDYWRVRDKDVYDLEKTFKQTIIKRVQKYEMPIIRLTKDNGREAVCTIFEKVNVGGVKLDAFELVTAIYAGQEFDLRRDWSGTKTEHGRLGRIRTHTPEHGIHANLKSLDFLQACTVLHTLDKRESAAAAGKEGLDLPQVTCKREAVLSLPLQAYRSYADKLETGFIEAGKFLNEQKILWGYDVPYPPQVTALAALFARVGVKTLTAADREKLTHWYWAGVLGENYGSSTETKISRDVPELESWFAGGVPPRTYQESLFQAQRLLSLRTRGSAAYKGFHALLMRSGCRDFISGKPVDVMTIYESAIDIHHIFPRAWCDAQGIEPRVYNSIINKTALSAESNRTIGGHAPSIYLASIEKRGVSTEMLDEILRSHLIDPDLLRADDFHAFFADRAEKLAELAAQAMHKDVVGTAVEQSPEDEAEDLSLDEEESPQGYAAAGL
jgi:hypothetical protein